MQSISFNSRDFKITVTTEVGTTTDYTTRAAYIAAYPDREVDWDALEASQNQQTSNPAVPQQVTMRQARLELLKRELLDDVEALIESAGRAAQIEWEYGATVNRNHPIISIVQQQKGMTDSQIDELFISASSL